MLLVTSVDRKPLVTEVQQTRPFVTTGQGPGGNWEQSIEQVLIVVLCLPPEAETTRKVLPAPQRTMLISKTDELETLGIAVCDAARAERALSFRTKSPIIPRYIWTTSSSDSAAMALQRPETMGAQCLSHP